MDQKLDELESLLDDLEKLTEEYGDVSLGINNFILFICVSVCHLHIFDVTLKVLYCMLYFTYIT